MGARECAVCRRDVRGLEDARKEGKLWFCSDHHFLSYNGPRDRKPARKSKGRFGTLGKIVVKWTLIVFGLLFLALVIAAIAGIGDETTDTGTAAKKKTMGKPPVGAIARPVPLGKAAAVGDHWRMRVAGVTPNANKIVWRESIDGRRVAARVAPGAQLVMFHLVATYVGGGSAHVGELVIRVNTIGKHGVSYDVISDDCRASVPGTDLIRVTDRVFSGRTVGGNVCFQVAKNDVSSLRLYVEPSIIGWRRKVWFSLK